MFPSTTDSIQPGHAYSIVPAHMPALKAPSPAPMLDILTMTMHLDNGVRRIASSITALARFPADKAEPHLLATMQCTLDGIVVIDTRHRIVLVNGQAEQLFGHPAEYLLDQSLETVIPSPLNQINTGPNLVSAWTADAGNTIRVTVKGLSSDGKLLSLNMVIMRTAIQDEDYFVLIVHDHALGSSAYDRLSPPLPSELRRLAATSQKAAEIEKRRFSRTLYDDIGQRLSVLKLDLHWLENSPPEERNNVPARVARMQGLLDNVIAATKTMAATLRPPLLDDLGLLPTVEWLVENFRKRTDIACVLQSSGMEAGLDDTVQSAVFRLMQEGLSNIERHSQARNVTIGLHRHADEILISIEDDGVGMHPGSENKAGCYGLLAMQERVVVLGGTISVRNNVSNGVTIQASIPLDPLFPANNNSLDHVL